jgi:hypothetical protein
MRHAGWPAHAVGVQRYLLDIGRDDDDRITGHVTRAGQAPVAFSGWLELLRLLEDRIDGTDERPVEATG